MKQIVTQDLAGLLLAAQGVQPAPGATAGTAESASRLLEQSAAAFAGLEFADEPSGFVAAQRRNAP